MISSFQNVNSRITKKLFQSKFNIFKKCQFTTEIKKEHSDNAEVNAKKIIDLIQIVQKQCTTIEKNVITNGNNGECVLVKHDLQRLKDDTLYNNKKMLEEFNAIQDCFIVTFTISSVNSIMCFMFLFLK